MGNQALTLPEGDGGKALRDMAAPTRMPSADASWCELLKVALPGIEQSNFMDGYYNAPEALDSLVRNEYFLQLVATNENSGNFKTFLRFWARILHHCRKAPPDAAPCSVDSLLSLSLLCRCLLKQFAESFSAPELIFQLEQVPCISAIPNPAPGTGALLDGRQEAPGMGMPPTAAAEADTPPDAVQVSYRGFHHTVRLPFADRPTAEMCADATKACLEAFCEDVPEDAPLLQNVERCGLRDIAAGETFAAADALEKAIELDSQELVICPCAVPRSLQNSTASDSNDDGEGRCHSGVVRSMFREIVDFLITTSFGAISGNSPSLVDTDADALEGQSAPRNLSVGPQLLHLQVLLLEISLSLAAVVAPRYGSQRHPDTSSHNGADRFSFVAPYLFTSRPWSMAMADRLQAPSHKQVQTGKETQHEELVGFTAVDKKDIEGDTAAASGAAHSAGSEGQLSFALVALPPVPGEAVSLPFLTSLLEVLEETPDQDTTGTATGTASNARPRAEALLTTLLNAVWLEPHAWAFAKPPKEVLILLTGVASAVAATSLFSTATREKTSGSDDRKDARQTRAAATSATRLATRAITVLLLLLFYETEAHSKVARAFATLTDPLLDHSSPGRHASPSMTAPLNFPMLLHTVLNRLQQGHGAYALLFYALINKNVGFRRFCLCRDAAEVLMPLLEALHTAPHSSTNKEREAVPSWAMALLLCLVSLTADKSLCESASRTQLPDSGNVLGSMRTITRVTVSSLVVIVALRLGQWNFASCKDAFFNRAIAAVLSNLARHDLENLHWSAASRTLELSQLLARNELKDRAKAAGDAADSHVADRRRRVMIRDMLQALVRMISGCLVLPGIIKNCTLVYALQRQYPDKFAELEEDAALGPHLKQIRAVVDWFEAQCPSLDGNDDSDDQIVRLEAAAKRIPSEFEAMVASTPGAGGFAYAETAGASAYFLPAVWQAASQLLPPNICWSPPRATAASPAQ